MKKNICLLNGNWFQRKGVLNKLKDSLADYELFIYTEKDSFEYVEQQIMEYSCFAVKKLIIINGLPFSKKTRTTVLKYFAKMIVNAPENCYIILNNLTISSDSFLKIIEERTKIIKFDQNIPLSSVKGRILGYFQNKGRRFEDDDDISLIIESLPVIKGSINLDKLFLLLKKIENYIGQRKKIKKEDIISICSQYDEFIIWNLYNILDNKENFCQIFSLLESLTSVSSNITQTVMDTLNSMKWRYKILLYVYDCLYQKVKQKDIWHEVSKLNKLERTGFTYRLSMKEKVDKNGKTSNLYSPVMVNSLFRKNYNNPAAVTCYERNELLNITNVINKGILKIRIGCTDNEAISALEIICMFICGKIKDDGVLDNQKTFILGKVS